MTKNTSSTSASGYVSEPHVGGFSTLRGLLEHHVKTMRLKPDAAWPSEIQSTKDFIKSWQRAQQHSTLHAVRGYGPDDRDVCDRDSDDSDLSVSVGA